MTMTTVIMMMMKMTMIMSMLELPPRSGHGCVGISGPGGEYGVLVAGGTKSYTAHATKEAEILRSVTPNTLTLTSLTAGVTRPGPLSGT